MWSGLPELAFDLFGILFVKGVGHLAQRMANDHAQFVSVRVGDALPEIRSAHVKGSLQISCTQNTESLMNFRRHRLEEASTISGDSINLLLKTCWQIPEAALTVLWSIVLTASFRCPSLMYYLKKSTAASAGKINRVR